MPLALGGRPAPLLTYAGDNYQGLCPEFLSGARCVRVAPDGKKLYFPVGLAHQTQQLVVLGADGSSLADTCLTPIKLPGKDPFLARYADLAFSADGQVAYLSGLKNDN